MAGLSLARSTKSAVIRAFCWLFRLSATNWSMGDSRYPGASASFFAALGLASFGVFDLGPFLAGTSFLSTVSFPAVALVSFLAGTSFLGLPGLRPLVVFAFGVSFISAVAVVSVVSFFAASVAAAAFGGRPRRPVALGLGAASFLAGPLPLPRVGRGRSGRRNSRSYSQGFLRLSGSLL